MNAIQSIRERLSATQAELADIVGRDQSTVSRWERGVESPRLEDIKKLRQAVLDKGLSWSDELLFPDTSSDDTSSEAA